METPKKKNATNMSTTLKTAANDDRFKKACEVIKHDQHVRLINGWYDYTGLKDTK